MSLPNATSASSDALASSSSPADLSVGMPADPSVEELDGTVKWFDVKKGFGFIVGPEGQDVFVHFSSINCDGFRTLKDGESVHYELLRGDKGYHARNVRRDGTSHNLQADSPASRRDDRPERKPRAPRHETRDGARPDGRDDGRSEARVKDARPSDSRSSDRGQGRSPERATGRTVGTRSNPNDWQQVNFQPPKKPAFLEEMDEVDFMPRG